MTASITGTVITTNLFVSIEPPTQKAQVHPCSPIRFPLIYPPVLCTLLFLCKWNNLKTALLLIKDFYGFDFRRINLSESFLRKSTSDVYYLCGSVQRTNIKCIKLQLIKRLRDVSLIYKYNIPKSGCLKSLFARPALRRMDGTRAISSRRARELPEFSHHAVRAAWSLCRGVWALAQTGCLGCVDARRRWSSPAEGGRLKLRQTGAAFVLSPVGTWAVSVCRTTARALLVCFFPVPPPLPRAQFRVGVSVGGQLSFFMIRSPFPLFVVAAVLGAALLLFLADFCTFMILTWTFPLLPPLPVFWSAGLVAAAHALRLFALLTFGFLLFLLLLLSGGFLWSFWRACLRLGLLRFVAFGLHSGTLFTGERRIQRNQKEALQTKQDWAH